MPENSPSSDSNLPAFTDLGLAAPVIEALNEVGYESPSPIQAGIIPELLAGHDVLGQAQTGTGKTAAFALPVLSALDLDLREPQALVLAPTRELAIQVAEAFQKYASKMPGFHVLPIYGGQSYTPQLRALDRGVHVVVGTPGRVVDHLKKGTLRLNNLRTLVLDEADEMLRMGFVDDVEWVLTQTPPERQVALFSATMPAPIRRIAQSHLTDAAEVKIAAKTSTAENIRQRVWQVQGMHKLDALTRILEGEDYDGVIVFVRTKISTVELAEKLAARGHEAEAINGDMDQRHRERTIEQFRAGRLDILVATDVVARGIDVDRVSHVVNFDIPYDTESYVHRIGRTGRAGRRGEAILFAAPRERRMLRAIERATRQRIENMDLPTVSDINDRRVNSFKQDLIAKLAAPVDEDPKVALYRKLIAEVTQSTEADPLDIAAFLAYQVNGERGLLLEASDPPPRRERPDHRDRGRDRDRDRGQRDRFGDGNERPRRDRGPRQDRDDSPPMVRYRLAVGREHGAEARHIVGALANEAGLESAYIQRLDIQEQYSEVDLPEGMPKAIFKQLRKAWVAGRQLNIEEASSAPPPTDERGARPSRPRRDRSDGDDHPRGGKRRFGDKSFSKRGDTKARTTPGAKRHGKSRDAQPGPGDAPNKGPRNSRDGDRPGGARTGRRPPKPRTKGY